MHSNLKRQEEAAKMRTWKGESCGGGPLHRNWNLMLGYLAYLGFPGDSDAKEWGRPGFDPSVGKMPWRRAWQSTPVFLPGESHGQRSLAGYSPWGRRVRHDRSNLAPSTIVDLQC